MAEVEELAGLGSAFHFSADPMYVWARRSTRLQLVGMNDAAERVPHSDARSLLGLSAADIYAESAAEVRHHLELCADTREPLVREIDYRFPLTGVHRRLLVSYSPAPPDLVVASVRDVHEAWGRFHERDQRVRELEQLTLLTQSLLEPETAQHARELFCASALDLAEADAVYLAELRDDTLVQTARAVAAGMPEDVVITIPLVESTHSITREVFFSARSVFIPDFEVDPRVDLERTNAIHAASGFFEPVVVRGQVLAVLMVAWRFPMPACPEHVLRLMPLLAAHAGVTISREDHIETLSEQATRDPLTGLPNRRTADAELVRHLAHASRTGHPLSVAVLDVNGLKEVNDTEGHEAGDALLRRAATAWRGALRRDDQLARIGGDEFVLVMPDTDAAEAERAVLRLRATAPEVSVAAGVAQWQDHQEAKDLLDLADRSMYEDKQLQRGLGRLPFQ